VLGRVVPAVRTFISAPAEIARMAIGRFLAFSALGSLVWTGTLAAGQALGVEYHVVGKYLGPVSSGIVALAVLVYLYRLYRVLVWSSGRAA
jgi:membrane protein DedA with SNARE-associated domain